MQTSSTFQTKPAVSWRLHAAVTSKVARWVAAAALAAGSLPLMQPAHIAQAAGNISGTVFQDFNSNGARDTSGANGTAVDIGVAGISISAYDASGALRGSTTSGNTGGYTLIATGSGPYRIEFTNLPTGFEPTTHSSTAGGNATSVQFVPDGNSSNINFAINQPCEYCQDGAKLAEALHKIDFTLQGGLPGSERSTQTVAVINSGANHGQPNHTPAFSGISFQSNVTQTGGLWGIAWDRTRRSLYVASVFRRETDVGPSGIGGIYAVDPSAAAQNGVPFMTIANVGDPRPGGQPDLADTTAITGAGKVGLGGIDLSDDDSKLYVMNLNTRRLVQVDVASKTETTSYAVNNPGCANANDVRPWAVKVYRNQVYIGVTCSGETANSLTGQNAYVMRLTGSTFTPVGALPLAYAKDTVYDPANVCGNAWYAWNNSADALACSSGAGKVRPEPLLSALEFDSDGSIIAGFLDRFMFKTAPRLFDSPRSGGDVRRLCNVAGTYVAEGGAGCAFKDADEYYIGDSYISPDWYGNVNYTVHMEIGTGGLALIPGATDVAVSAFDPVDNAWNNGPNGRAAETSGVMWLNNNTGSKTRGVFTTAEQTGSFGKGGSAGDIEYLCDPAPIEIGNRVWADANGNGIQDPGEAVLPSVIVSMQTPTGTLTTQTDANGNYYFGNLQPNTAYSITVAPAQAALNGAQLTQPNANGLTNNTPITDVRDSDATLVNNTPTIFYTTGTPGQNNHSLDIGFYRPASLGNYVWDDTNHDGLQNDGNTGLGNVPVTLYDVNGAPVSTTLTNPQGFYSFTNLTPGTYSVGFTAPAGYTFTFQGSTANSDADSNVAPAGRTAPITLGAGENNPTIDAGLWLPAPAISLKKYTNGIDADVVPGPYLPIGSAVTWRFDVRNTGNVTLTNLILTDDKVGAITCPQTALGPNQLMSCTATGVATAGQYANTGIVTGTNQANPGQTVSSTDPSHYFGSNAGLTIKKYTNDQDADSLPGPFVAAGSTVTWTYVVANTGNTALVNITVTDDVIGAVTCPQTTLGVAENMTCTMTGIAINGQYTNTGTVVGTDPNNLGNPLTANDPSHYYGSNAGLVLKKFVNAGGLLPPGDDAQTAPGISVAAGSPVTWTYVMTNTGNVTLTKVALTDDKIGAITCPATTLAAGESMTCTATGTAIAGQYTNMGTVSANDATNPNGPTLTANDPANYFGTPVAPLVASLGNYVWVDVNRDGQQGDPAVEPPLAGVTVTLYNSSGAAIATTTTDASGFYSFTNLVPGTYSVGFTLPPGYAVTQQGTDPASPTDSNVNPATGRTEPVTLVGGENNPTLDAGVVLNAPGISLKKFVNAGGLLPPGDDAQTAPGVLAQVGRPVTWTYVLKNIGNVALNTVALTDDKEGTITCPDSMLAVNEEMTCTKTGIATAGQYTNIGTVTAKDATNPNGPTLTSADPANYFAGAPQLVIRKRSIPVESVGNTQVVVDIGDRITYTLQVTNTGAFTATNVRISDGIPAGTQFVVGSAAPAQNSGPTPLVWNLGSLAPGATASVRFAVTVVNRDPVAVQNTAAVVSNETVTTTNSNTVVHVFKPTAVELISFSVSGQRVQWMTGAELNTFGFAIYRGNTRNRSDATLVSLEMIAAKGNNARYEFVDTQADASASYSYWLAEIETTGATVEYGPVKTDVGANGTNETDAASVVIHSQLPIANSVVAGGVAVKLDGAAAGMAAPATNVAVNAAPAQAAQGVSVVNAETVSVTPRDESVQAVQLVQPTLPTQPVAVAPVQPAAASASEPVAPAAVPQIERPEAPGAATKTGVQVGTQQVAQRAAGVVAQPKAATHNAVAQRSPTQAIAQAALLASAVAGTLALLGGLGIGLFVVARRKRS